MNVIERNLQEIGKSLLVTLPKSWTNSLKLKKGSKIKIMISEQGNLLIAPEFVKKQSLNQETTIIFDEFFSKRFFKAYFHGYDKIIINFKDRHDGLYEFLKKFMNVQIIEESSSRVVVKVFKIDELSIQECLKRMFFLSINMFDEVGNKSKLQELRISLIKFYYMLVMQIRRFLSEGKYTEENQISLIKAMDYRMIAEKIERISGVLLNLKKDSYLVQIKEFYSDSFNYFINEEFDKSLGLLKQEKILLNKIKNKDLLEILKYAKNIGMLIK